jgi:hypothetical protein
MPQKNKLYEPCADGWRKGRDHNRLRGIVAAWIAMIMALFQN